MRTTVPYEAFLQLDTGTHHGEIVQIAATRDGKTLVSAGETTLRVWNADERRLERLLLGQVAGTTDDSAEGGKVLRLAISPDQRWVVVLKSWLHASVASARPAALPDSAYEAVVSSAVQAGRDADAALGHDQGMVTEVQVFELATGNLQSRFLHPGLLLDLVLSPDGRWLVLAGNAVEGRQRRACVSVLVMRDVIKPGARLVPQPVASLSVGDAQASDILPLALRCVPSADADAEVGAGADASLHLVLALCAPGAGSGQLVWMHFSRKGGLVAEPPTSTAAAINPATLAVNAAVAVVAVAPRRGRQPLGRLLWFDHASRRAAGQLVTEAPAAATAFSPSGAHLLVGLSTERIGGIEAAPGDQTVQVNAYRTSPYGGFELCSSYFGHDGMVRALCLRDDQTAVSAGGDNHAIHLWRFGHRIGTLQAAIRGVGQTIFAPGVTGREQLLFGTVPARLLPPRHAQRQQRFDLRRRLLDASAPSALRQDDFESRKWFIFDSGGQVIALRHSPDAYGSELDLPPDLSLFVGADDEWVMWSRSGYYDASPDGARRIGYRINRGVDKEALFIPADRFKAFYRPDIIAAIVQHGSQARARERSGLVIEPVAVATILPPIVELAHNGVTVADGQVRFCFTVDSPCPEYPLQRVSILHNDRFVWHQVPPSRRPRSSYAVTLPLRPGRNRFSIRAENAQARSVPVEHELIGPLLGAADAAAFGAPGHLFLLCVGVSDFAAAGTPQAGPFKALHCAHLDAAAVFEAFAATVPGAAPRAPLRPKNLAFEAVEGALLVNAEATRAAILRELDRLCALIRRRQRAPGAERDVLMVFLSGHGVRFEGAPDLYFWNYDLQPPALEETALSMLDLGDRITSVPAEVVLVVDACHAAMAGSNVMVGLDAEELARRVHAVNERGMYVLNAAQSEEKARESRDLGLGIFTATMLQALTSERFFAPDNADARHRSISMTALMAGIQQLLPQLSARAGTRPQTPVFRTYGDLLPLTIYGRAGGAALPRAGTSRMVPIEQILLQPRGNRAMATKKAPAKKASAKKVAAKKAVATKVAVKKSPAKKVVAKKVAVKGPAAKPVPAKKTPKVVARAAPVTAQDDDDGRGGIDFSRPTKV